MLANQWDELLCGNQKRNCVNKTKQPQNDETRQPIRISQREELFEKTLVVHSDTLRMRPTKVQCLCVLRRAKTPSDVALDDSPPSQLRAR
jgi:hypothetical protein